jgi:PPOX class probable F420-dependent enzyme
VRDNRAVPALEDPQELWRRVTAAPVARLATLRRDGTPRLVPVTFAAVRQDDVDLLCFAVDTVKPKRGTRLARLADIDRDPRVALLVDHYADDWSTLWWVRVDGRAAVAPDGPLRERALAALAAKYPPYRTAPPPGPVVAITPVESAGWTAT